MPFWSDLFCTNKIPNSLCLLVSRSAHARTQFYCGAWFTNCAQIVMIGMIAVTHVCLYKKNPLEDIVLVKRVSWQMSGAWNLLLKKCYTILCSEGWVENDHGWGCMIKSFRVKWSFHRWDNRPTNSKESYPLCSTDGASFLKIQLTTGDLYYYYYFFFLPVFQVTRITYFINVESVSFTINALVCGTSVSEIYRYEWTSQRLAETGRSSRCTQNLDELVFTCAEPVCPFVRALLAFRQI